MADLLFIAITIAFFAIAAGFVKLCDRIIGPDDATDLALGEPERIDGGRRMTADNVIGLVLAVLVAGYLVAALVFPETVLMMTASTGSSCSR